MSENISSFEAQLGSLRLTGKSADHAMLFYRCGYNAAESAQRGVTLAATPRRWQLFAGGMASGIAFASLLWLGTIQINRASDTAAPSMAQEVIAPETANIEPVAVPSQPDFAIMAEFSRMDFASLVPWQWPLAKEEPVATDLTGFSLSPAANQQWVSIAEECGAMAPRESL